MVPMRRRRGLRQAASRALDLPMNIPKPTLFNRLAGFLRFVFWGLLVLIVVVMFFSRGSVEASRTEALERFQAAREARA